VKHCGKPRNVGILFFYESPEKFLPGTQIDVVIFPKRPGGGELIEKTFRGLVHEQAEAFSMLAVRRGVRNVFILKMVSRRAWTTSRQHWLLKYCEVRLGSVLDTPPLSTDGRH